MGQVKFTFTGDKTQLEQAYKDLAKSNARLEEQVKKLADTSKQGTDSASKGFGGFSKSIMGSVASMVSLATVTAAANQELQEMVELQDKVKNTNIEVGRSQSKLLFNLAGRDMGEVRKALADLQTINRDTKFGDVKDLYGAFNDALAATGGDIEISKSIVRAAAPLSRGSPEDLRDISMGAATLQQTLGLSPEQAIAFQSTVGGPSFIKDPAQQARYIPAGIRSALETLPAKTRDEKIQAAREIGAVMSALGAAAGDTEGMATRTDIIDLSVELRDFFEKGTKVKVGNREFNKKFGPDPGTFLGRIEAIANDDRMSKAFLENTTSEKQFTVAREQLMKRGGRTLAKAREFLPMISSDEKQYRELESLQNQGTRQIEIGNLEREYEANKQLNELRDIGGDAAKSQAKKIHSEVLAKTRKYGIMPTGLKTLSEYFIGGTIQRGAEAIGYDPIQQAIGDLKAREKQITKRRNLTGSYEAFYDETIPENKLTPQQIEDRSYVRAQLQVLEKLQEFQRQQLEESKRQTELLQQQDQPTGSPRAEIGRHRE